MISTIIGALLPLFVRLLLGELLSRLGDPDVSTQGAR